jgi:hypothetical protein
MKGYGIPMGTCKVIEPPGRNGRDRSGHASQLKEKCKRRWKKAERSNAKRMIRAMLAVPGCFSEDGR